MSAARRSRRGWLPGTGESGRVRCGTVGQGAVGCSTEVVGRLRQASGRASGGLAGLATRRGRAAILASLVRQEAWTATHEHRGGLSSMAEQRFVEPPVEGSSPSGHPNPPAAIVLRRRPTARAMLAGHGPKDRSPRRLPIFAGLEPRSMEAVATLARIVSLPADTVLLREGETAEFLLHHRQRHGAHRARRSIHPLDVGRRLPRRDRPGRGR